MTETAMTRADEHFNCFGSTDSAAGPLCDFTTRIASRNSYLFTRARRRLDLVARPGRRRHAATTAAAADASFRLIDFLSENAARPVERRSSALSAAR